MNPVLGLLMGGLAILPSGGLCRQAQDGQTADEWMARLERAVREAGSLDVEVRIEEGGREVSRARLAMARGGRFALDVTPAIDGAPFRRLEMRSDGQTVRARVDAEEGEEPVPLWPTPVAFLDSFPLAVARVGVASLVPLLMRSREEEPVRTLDRVFSVQGLSLEGEEVIDGRRSVCLAYTIVVADGRGSAHAIRLWLDAETAWPTRRVISAEGALDTIEDTIETYSRFAVGSELPAETLQFPEDHY